MTLAHMPEAEVGRMSWIQLGSMGIPGCVPSGVEGSWFSIYHESCLPDSISGQKMILYPWKQHMVTPKFSIPALKINDGQGTFGSRRLTLHNPFLCCNFLIPVSSLSEISFHCQDIVIWTWFPFDNEHCFLLHIDLLKPSCHIIPLVETMLLYKASVGPLLDTSPSLDQVLLHCAAKKGNTMNVFKVLDCLVHVAGEEWGLWVYLALWCSMDGISVDGALGRLLSF